MLVLSRHLGERVFLRLPDGTEIVVQVVAVSRDGVRLGIEAPKPIVIWREELDPLRNDPNHR